jgi:predicted MFS family arabinose efflux permease
MLQSVTLFTLVATGTVAYWHIVLLALLLGLSDTLHLTARHALIPLLVSPGQVPRAVAINSAGMNLTQVLGPSLGGLLLGLVGTAGCLAINAVSFLAIFAALFFMRWRPAPVTRAPTGVVRDLREGVDYVRAREQLWVPMILAWCVAALAMAYTRLLPLFASDVLHGGERLYGIMLASPGLGAVLASLGVARRGQQPSRKVMYYATFSLVAGLLAFAGSRSVALSLLALATVGGAQMVFRTMAIASLHQATDDAHRGRVLAIFLLDYGLWSFGTLWLGFLAELSSPPIAVAVGALSCLTGALVVAWVSRRLRRRATVQACAARPSSSSWS